jgi:putative inorganic carbon (HCO3(-)) transporter
MLRTLFVLTLVATGIKYSFQGAFYILLFYLWNAYFRPDQWVWSGIIQQLRLSLTVGVALIIVSFFSSDRFRFSAGTLLLFAFLAQSLLSTMVSPVSAALWPAMIEFIKVVLISYLIVTLVNTEKRLRLTLIVIALSLGFEGARQGWAQLIVNPGGRNTNEWVMLGDNNGVAIGMLMLFPLLVALAQTTKDRSRYVAWFLSIGVLYRAISTYSRGGFLAASALALHYAVRSKHRLAAVLGVLAMAGFVSWVMPDAYWERISTVKTAADTTEANRIGFWMLGLDMANDYPATGVGLDGYRYMYDRYDPTFGLHGRRRDIHSTWFGVLAEVGYPGFVIFLLLLGNTALTARRVRRLAMVRPDLANLAVYATVMEAQVLVFAVGGTFITLQYKEFIWHVFALSMAVDHIIRRRLSDERTNEAGGQRDAGAAVIARMQRAQPGSLPDSAASPSMPPTVHGGV